MSSLNVAAYGEGVMYPPNLSANISAIQTAGWTSVIVSLFHINTSGDIYINDTKIFTGGKYIGSPDWPGQLQQLLQGQGSTITTARIDRRGRRQRLRQHQDDLPQ
jgi:hypothetical protein